VLVLGPGLEREPVLAPGLVLVLGLGPVLVPDSR